MLKSHTGVSGMVTPAPRTDKTGNFWVQLKHGVENLFQGREIQMRLARIVIVRTAATDHESASDNPRQTLFYQAIYRFRYI